jgi:hypothetical protein
MGLDTTPVIVYTMGKHMTIPIPRGTAAER